MAELPSEISVTTRQSIDVLVGEMGRDLKYIIKSIDELKGHQSKQDDIINGLRANCNREERWETAMVKIDDTYDRITKIERGKCPKLAVLNDIEGRLSTLESTHQQDTGAQVASNNTREYVSYIIMILLAALNLWQFIQGSK